MTVNDTTATITNLYPGSPYNISVVAINEAGESVRTKLTNELTSTYNYWKISFLLDHCEFFYNHVVALLISSVFN